MVSQVTGLELDIVEDSLEYEDPEPSCELGFLVSQDYVTCGKLETDHFL